MTPDSIESQHTLATAVARYDTLRARDLLAWTAADLAGAQTPDPAGLTQQEALELLALSEAISRKAGYGRQLTVQSARAAGASWSHIGAALGTTKQAAWEAHSRWIDQQSEHHGRMACEGLDAGQVAAARDLAGSADDERRPG